MPPNDLNQYLIERLDNLPAAARLVIVLDPGGRLGLSDDLVDSQRIWQVLRYDGNDLAFRRQFNLAIATLVWVTGHPTLAAGQPYIDLSSLPDILRCSEAILDASLLGVLCSLFPNETWPAAPLAAYADIIGVHLSDFIRAYQSLKPHLGANTALNTYSIQALVLACLHPNYPALDFLFRVDTPVLLLKRYVSIAWTLAWDAAGLQLLQQQARAATLLPLGNLEPWFDVDMAGLAQLIYFYRFLSSARLPNIINQIRGMGLLSFDPDPLQPGLGQVMALWEKDPVWRDRLIQTAEDGLDLETIHRAVALVEPDSPDLAQDIANAEAPAFLYSLTTRLVEQTIKPGKLHDSLAIWLENKPAWLNRLSEDATAYSPVLLALGHTLDEMAFILGRIAQPFEAPAGLDNLVNWYVTGQYYDLEYAHARALMSLSKIKEEPIRSYLQAILDKLRAKLRQYLDHADHELARRIQHNWYAYTTSAELSTHVLKDFVERPRLLPSESACLWLVIFDGMRFDTWNRVVKPCLQQAFEIKKEKAYLSVLPSWTGIARTALTAARTPDLWQNHRNHFTTNQAILAGKFFALSESQSPQKLRFYSGMESDRTISQFDRTRRFPYNILIFNISDDDLHKQRDHIGALNENIKSAVERILNFLDGLIQKDDTLIISSDHGFMELDPGYAIVVKESNKWQRYIEGGEHPVRYRFIRSDGPVEGLPQENVFTFEWKMPDGKFTVPIGRWWFQRETSKNPDRYSHGGLSFAEMLVPGAVMCPIQQKRVDLHFEGLPKEISVNEGQLLNIHVSIVNRGNQPALFDLQYSLDTDRSPQNISQQVPPAQKLDLPLSLTPLFLTAGKKTTKLALILNYTTSQGQPQLRRQDIPVTVIERTDVVEISLGGLDDLDL